jgi:hypothetical protein
MWLMGGLSFTSGFANDVWFTPGSNGNSSGIIANLMRLVKSGDDDATFTPTPTVNPNETMTPTTTPTATPMSSLVASVFAAPNLSHGEPVNIHFTLSENARVTLTIFTVMGQQIYSTTVEGAQGVNSLIWDAKSQAKNGVASGIYIYTLQIQGSGGKTITKTGKIAILR